MFFVESCIGWTCFYPHVEPSAKSQAKLARQGAASTEGAHAKPRGGGGGSKGQPDHARVGEGVSL